MMEEEVKVGSRKVYLDTDAGFINPVRTLVYSILKNADPTKDIEFFIAHDQSFSDEGCREKLDEIVRRFSFARVHYIDATPVLAKYARELEHPYNVLSPVIWCTQLISEILPEDVTGNILYLDADMLVLKDLEPLFSVDLSDENTVAAVVIEDKRECFGWMQELEWQESAKYYFNNGTIVFNLDHYRKHQLAQKCIKWYVRNKDKAISTNNDTENAVFGGMVKYVHARWNYNDRTLRKLLKFQGPWKAPQVFGQDWKDVLEAILDPGIIHYVTGKPWKYGHRPERKTYHRYMKELGWYDERLCGRGVVQRLDLAIHDLWYRVLRTYARWLLRRLSES